jgi:hypothetical protein
LTGLFGPIRAGGGKTLITLLLPTVLFSKRPLLIVPAKLVDKTKRALKDLLLHFRCAYHIHVLSYESLSRVSHATFLEELNPDLVILDEAHKVKNPRAAVTKRLRRFIEKFKPRVVPLSGTVTKRSLHDYGHLIRWALGDGSPLPNHFPELEDWANCLDERPRAAWRTSPGALTEFSEGHSEDLTKVREGFCRRVIETPGVVATNDQLVGCSLVVSRLTQAVPQIVEEAFKKLRVDWETPDGEELFDAMRVSAVSRQLALGFYYRWKEPGPKDWREARKAWAKFVRETLKKNRSGIDSELQVAQACARGWLPDAEYVAWRELRPTFTPESEIVWLSDFALTACTEWLDQGSRQGKIIWTEHVKFAEELSRRTGLPYAGGGEDPSDATKYVQGAPTICSIKSSGEGRDLQPWFRNLVTSPPYSGLEWEQLLARTHRDGQDKDEVTYDVFSFAWEQEKAFVQACNDALYRTSTTQQPDRLTYSDVLWPTFLSREPFVSSADLSSSSAWACQAA